MICTRLKNESWWKKWRTRAFESEREITYDIKIPNGMNRIHKDKVNKTAECNLIHDIINTSKRTKNLDSNYSPILHGIMNRKNGIENVRIFKSYWIVDVVPLSWLEG